AEIAYDLLQTPDKGYALLCNSAFYGAGMKDVMLVRSDSAGNLIWAKTYGGAQYEDCWYMQQTPDKGFAFVAETQSFGSGQGDIYFVKTDSLGNSGCHDSIVIPGVRNPVMMDTSGIDTASGGTPVAHLIIAGN